MSRLIPFEMGQHILNSYVLSKIHNIKHVLCILGIFGLVDVAKQIIF